MTAMDDARLVARRYAEGWSVLALAFHYDCLPETILDILSAMMNLKLKKAIRWYRRKNRINRRKEHGAPFVKSSHDTRVVCKNVLE